MEQYELKGVLSETATGVEFENGKAMSRVLRKWKGKTLHIVIKPFKRKRSDNQNRWMWGVAYVCIQAYLKETEGSAPSKEEIHLHNLQIVQGVKIESKVILGETVFTVNEKRTSSMSTVEFNEMKEKLQAYWAERDCIIPDPNEDNFLTDYAKDE